MNIFSRMICLLLLGISCSQTVYSQQSTPKAILLNGFDNFRDPGKNWMIGAGASARFDKADIIKLIKGSGVLVNISQGTDLVTAAEFGDMDLELDFMMAKDAVSGIYLQGRYEITLADSWTKLNPTFTDLGGIGPKEGDYSLAFNGKAPLVNAARAPGLWQHLRVKFRAPKFDENGMKTANAYFEEVYINDVLVQVNVEVSGITKGASSAEEKASGPLVFEGGKGSIAFRNIQSRILPELKPPLTPSDPRAARRLRRAVNPIILNPNGRTYTLRSFMNFGGKKRTYVVSVGNPNLTNYSYDVKQGALFQIWRGEFVDVTAMWEGRGEPQLAKPLGSVLPLSVAPSFAVLPHEDTAWPDSIAFDDMHNKGYTLDHNRIPVFTYEVEGYSVTDKIFPQPNGESLIRELTVSNPPEKLYCRIASGKKIEPFGKGLYAIDGKTYYIQINERLKPSVRKTQEGEELIVPVTKTTTAPLTYSIIW